MEEKVEEMLTMLVDMAHDRVAEAKVKNYFSKDLVEACGIIASLVGRKE